MNASTVKNSTPHFGVGEVDSVERYVKEAIPRFCDRIGLMNDFKTLMDLCIASCRACAKIMPSVLTNGMVEPIPEARTFWRYVGDLLLDKESEILGAHHLDAAMAHLRNGGNVLMVQNHRSGADTLVWETIAARYYGYDVAQDWAYMSGHAVNLFMVPFMFTAAMRRFQIFSVKYQSIGLDGIADEHQMKGQNLRALRALSKYARTGGKLIGLYPEGGRGEQAMKAGEPQTMCVGLAIGKANPNLMLLPTYVDGAINVLPVSRNPNEYNEIFVNAQRGKASLTIGEPVMWSKLLSHPLVGAAESDQERTALCNQVLSRVAALAPDEGQMGPHAQWMETYMSL
jgi:1-acyl-sn-glycerol-3-phosphate acyltransferase